MARDYEIDPVEIERESFRRIRELSSLDAFDEIEQQVAMRVIHSLGLPEVSMRRMVVASLLLASNVLKISSRGLPFSVP